MGKGQYAMKRKYERVYLAGAGSDEQPGRRGFLLWDYSRRGWSVSRRERAARRDRRLFAGAGLAAACLMTLMLFRLGPVRSRTEYEPLRGGYVKSQESAVSGSHSVGKMEVTRGSGGINDWDSRLPVGLCGILRGLAYVRRPGTSVPRVGLRAENVQVGQRFQKVSSDSAKNFITESFLSEMHDKARELNSLAASIPDNAYLVTDQDYENLLKIVEAEAGTEDIKGRLLVANVILNRVRHTEFPDTVTDVIYDFDNGVAQFSPVMDGRIYDVEISVGTREAVRLALEGTDFSQGALFFIQKDIADEDCVKWFEENLQFLFKYGVHEFYRYYDD